MIKVEHENGYTGALYGRSSLSIYKEGREVLHTGSRNISTEKELYELLDRFPKMIKAFDDIYNDDESE